MRYPASGPPPRLRVPAALRPAAGERFAAGAPLASRSATRVSARSTLTSTCFFNLIPSFGIGGGRAPRARAADRRAQGPSVHTPSGRRQLHGTRIGALAHRGRAVAGANSGETGDLIWRGVLGEHLCLVAQYAALQCLRGARLDIDRLQ